MQFVGIIFRNVLQSMRKIASMITAWSPHDHGIMDHFAFSHPRSGCGCWLNQSVLPIWSNLFIKNNTVLGCDVCILIGRIQSSYLQTSPFRLIQSPFLLLQKSRLLLVKFAFFSSWISRTGWWLWWGWKPPSRWRVAGVHNVIGFWAPETGGIVTGWEVVIPKPRECGGGSSKASRCEFGPFQFRPQSDDQSDAHCVQNEPRCHVAKLLSPRFLTALALWVAICLYLILKPTKMTTALVAVPMCFGENMSSI